MTENIIDPLVSVPFIGIITA